MSHEYIYEITCNVKKVVRKSHAPETLFQILLFNFFFFFLFYSFVCNFFLAVGIIAWCDFQYLLCEFNKMQYLLVII